VRVTETTVIDEDGNREHKRILVDTTPGRCLLWKVVPEGMTFDQINLEMTKKNISKLINSCYRKLASKIRYVC
jgi:DNA-directed RNA polymerase subunit beta'